jgi:hypothetical protein
MVMPLTRIWFILGGVRYNHPNEKSDEPVPVFAEYDLIKRELVWKEWDTQNDKNMSIVSKIMLLGLRTNIHVQSSRHYFNYLLRPALSLQ